MFYGVVMVGARALHELVEVARRILLGLRARMISRGDQRGVGWSAAILSVLFSPLRGGALVLILALGFALALAFVVAPQGRRLLGGFGQRSAVLGHQGWDSGRCCVCLISVRAVHTQAVGAER